MSALIECRACGKPISPNAPSCPNCGEPNAAAGAAKPEEKQTATGCLAAILIGLIVGGILYWIITSS